MRPVWGSALLTSALGAHLFYATIAWSTGRQSPLKSSMYLKSGTMSTFFSWSAAPRIVMNNSQFRNFSASSIRSALNKSVWPWISVWCRVRINTWPVQARTALLLVFSTTSSTVMTITRWSVGNLSNARVVTLSGGQRLSLKLQPQSYP